MTASVFLPKPIAWFVGGRLMSAGAQRMIVASSGGAVTLSAPIPGLKAGDAFEAYPGCDHTLTTCAAKFGNQLNYGGFPFIPVKNPFTGDAIV
ncbi:phage BR0599 family protein [Ralstonia mannitolilytica]|uniref:phage BR0599 family protein n=1 Tax=Ralstonia mannitolilytica TaxID=105219 RepID=UPI0026EE9903|nr:phage BR0599 family protein [Ralstonia mannitolilytica]